MARECYRFKTLAELKAALDSAALPRREFQVIIDNDCTPGYLRGKDEDGEDDECVFDGGDPRRLLEEALTLLGVPWEGA